MKKILVASTVALSMAGIAKSPAFADENQATNRTQSSEQAVSNSIQKEDQKKSSSHHKETNHSANEGLNKTEKESSQSTPKKELSEKKEKTPTKADTEEVNKEGWQKENGQWSYYENKKAVTNWNKIAGHWYYFNKDGVMLSDTVYDGYLLNKSGAMVEDSWVKIGEKWYYASESGKIIRNKWEKINGSWYYFDGTGAMLSKSIYNDYLLQTNGAMHEKGWVKMDEKWYYASDSGKVIRNKWEKIKDSWYYFDTEGVMESAVWKKKYYLKDSGAMAQSEWIFDKKYNSWFYLKSDGSYAENQWQGSYYLKSYGYMAKNEWIFDKNYNAWYYLKEDGVYVTGNYTINGKEYYFLSNGKWISDQSSHYKVKPITAYIYSASGTRLSYINQGSIVTATGSETQNGRIPVQVSGLSGYMNKSDLTAVDASNEFIPHYTSDGRYVYHELSPYTSIRVAPHHSSMSVGKKYYSSDGINFDTFSINNPFQFRDLSKPTNYTAEELDKVYSLMNIKGSRLAGKGAIFKEAERRYQINALYLMAHSALESSWGRSQIAKDKNNFFGIAAYDSTPYDSAKSFDNVDKGILGAAKWIRENYLDEGRTHLGNKSSGMNVLYASDPYWGEKIASIMMTINSKLGEKD